MNNVNFPKITVAASATLNAVEAATRVSGVGANGVEGHGRGAVGGFYGVGTVFGAAVGISTDAKIPAEVFGGAIF